MQKYTTKNFIADIWFYVKAQKFNFFLGTFLRLVGDVSDLYGVYAVAAMVGFLSVYSAGDSLMPIYIIFGTLTLTTIIQHIGQHKGTMICYGIAAKAELEAKARVLNHLFYIDLDWHEKENSGNKVKRIDRGGAAIENVIRMWISNIISTFVNFLGVVFIIATFDLFFGIIMILFIVCFYLLSRIYRKRAIEAKRVESIQDEIVSGLMFESVSNIRTVKVMNMREKVTSKIVSANNNLLDKVMKRIFWFQTGSRVLTFFSVVFKIIALAVISYGIIHKFYAISFLVLFSGYFNRVRKTTEEFSGVTDNLLTAKSDISRMQDMLNEKIMIDNEVDKIPLTSDWQTIRINNLTFSYGDKKVLNNLTFDIKRGKKIGIVGLSGAGKSTLFKLLLKENESYEGSILFDDIPLKNISKKNYQTHTAVVLQDTELFNTSLKENIIIEDNVDMNESLINNAIETAYVKDFMDKLPLGIETVVGEKGVKLSGGEKQRVGIARAVYKKPELLLMDEATSHLDIESEKKIQDSLHEFFKEVTAVVIAHRLTTIKEMDKIIVLEEGKIIESGSFDELYNKKGRFFELWEKQKL